MKGFKQFMLRGNVVDLAVAVVMGAAFTAVVEVNALRFTSETGTPSSKMRTTEFGFAGSGGVKTKRTKSPAVEVLIIGRLPPDKVIDIARQTCARCSGCSTKRSRD